MPKICIGTASFTNLEYGFCSHKSDRGKNQFFKICKENKIDAFDTAPRYEGSENLLGKFQDQINFISTKVEGIDPNLSEDKIYRGIINSIESSLIKLKKDRLNLCYLHQNELEIISNQKVINALENVRKIGLIEEYGASIYTLQELKCVLNMKRFGWVQIPLNILDTSFLQEIKVNKNEIKVAARSIILQGLLLSKDNQKTVSEKFPNFNELMNKLRIISKKLSIHLSTLLISYIFSLKELDLVITGTSSSSNLQELIAASKLQLDNKTLGILDKLSSLPKEWTNPKLW